MTYKTDSPGPRFEPRYVNVMIGDRLRFQLTENLANPVTIETSVNSSFPCIAKERDNSTEPWFVFSGVSAMGFYDVDVTTANGYTTTYPFNTVVYKGNTTDCNANERASGAIIVSGNQTKACDSQTDRLACGSAGTVTESTDPFNGACVWCGTSDTDGYCFSPPWAGQFNCPCTQQSCFPDYGCPSDTLAVQCGSRCLTNGTQCPTFALPGSAVTTTTSLSTVTTTTPARASQLDVSVLFVVLFAAFCGLNL